MSIQDFRIIQTEDGTSSLYSNDYKQAMHSISGAYQEAFKKHVIPSKILELRNRELFVLDIGFGLGYNILALIFEFLRNETEQNLNITSLEMDFSHIPYINEINFSDERQCIYNNILNTVKKNGSDFSNYKIEIIQGDARDSIKKLKYSFFDAVFHDPYSPAKNPELWTVDFFKEVNRVMKNTAILTTYSSAVHIRRALLEAGFIIGKGPSVGRKREGTLASKKGSIIELNNDEIAALLVDHRSVPYRDVLLNNSRNRILQERLNHIGKGNSN